MDKAQLQFFKAMLTERLKELLGRAGATVSELLADGEGMPDPLDRAGFERDRSALLRIRDRESRLIGKIRFALADIEAGDYGICEGCGEEIPVARMMARPVTRYCIDCKRRLEEREQAAGG